MGDVLIAMGGGGGLDTDECTATRAQVLSGYTAGVHGEEEPAPGGMPNNGAQNAALDCGQSKQIPAGYTTGGIITANSLASQTPGNASDYFLQKGFTAWVNGKKITGDAPGRYAEYEFTLTGSIPPLTGDLDKFVELDSNHLVPIEYRNFSYMIFFGKTFPENNFFAKRNAYIDFSFKVFNDSDVFGHARVRTFVNNVADGISIEIGNESNYTLEINHKVIVIYD